MPALPVRRTTICIITQFAAHAMRPKAITRPISEMGLLRAQVTPTSSNSQITILIRARLKIIDKRKGHPAHKLGN